MNFFGNYTEEKRWSEPIRRARNSVNIFIEYACKDIAHLRVVQQVYGYFQVNHPESWIFQNYIFPHYKQYIPRKTQGRYLLTHFIIPLSLLTLYLLLLIIKMVCRCIGCSKKKEVPIVMMTPVNKQKKREKVE